MTHPSLQLHVRHRSHAVQAVLVAGGAGLGVIPGIDLALQHLSANGRHRQSLAALDKIQDPVLQNAGPGKQVRNASLQGKREVESRGQSKIFNEPDLPWYTTARESRVKITRSSFWTALEKEITFFLCEIESEVSSTWL